MTRFPAGLVFVVALALDLVAWYGGIRSPDGEVAFELCESLLDRRSVAVVGTSRWPGFGLAPGVDGRTYSIFGPAQSVACVPFLAAARAVPLPEGSPSFYVGKGLEAFVRGVPVDAADRRAHAERSFVTLLNPIVGAAAAAAFFVLARTWVRPAAAAVATAALVVATPLWHYSGTFLSEPLSALLLLLAAVGFARGRAGLGGAALGASVASHVTSILAVPFLLGWVRDRRALAVAMVAGVLAVLAAYNAVRFGSPLETGRTADPRLAAAFGYGTFTAPWRGLYGLVASPAKGLVWYAPIVLASLWAWPSLRRRAPLVSGLVAAMVVARIGFVACRTDWHGGFSLGPRLLVPIVPFLVLPIATWLEERWGDRRALAVFAVVLVACVAQQVAFVIGEPFTFYQGLRLAAAGEKVDVFAGDRLYLAAQFSPALHLLEHPLRGSWLLRNVPLGMAGLWALLSLLVGGGALALLEAGRREADRPAP